MLVQTMFVQVLDVDETPANVAPVFNSSGAATVNEGVATNIAVYDANARDPDGDNPDTDDADITYSLSGDDAGLFDIDTDTGEVTFKASPDHGTPGDLDGDNVYEFSVSASDGASSTQQSVAITVAEVTDPDAPLFSAPSAAVAVNEGIVISSVVHDANATDPNGGNPTTDDDGITYSLSGTDASAFDIDASTGEVTFLASPDYETPVDGNGDNVYELTITATDGEAKMTTQDVTVTVNDLTPEPAIVLDVGSLGASGFAVQGAAANDYAGWSVSDAGDVNGDGYDDVIIGAPEFGASGSGTATGKAYVIFGDATGSLGDIDLSSLAPDAGFELTGSTYGFSTARAVSSAGDVNGDGFDDLLIGAAGYAAGDGIAFVVFGGDALADVSLVSPLAASDGFTLSGNSAEAELAGYSIASAGDVNGDGFDDLIVGAPQADAMGTIVNSGRSYIIYGDADIGDLTLSIALSPDDGFFVDGALLTAQSGWQVSGIGDFDGDGYDDVIVARQTNEVAVIYGGENLTSFDTGELLSDTSRGFLIDVPEADGSNTFVSGLGDVNGDGYDDLIVSSTTFNTPEDVAVGAVFIVFGQDRLTQTNIHLEERDPGDPHPNGFSLSNGIQITGIADNDLTGFSVSGAGDLNGDGHADLIVGVPRDDSNSFNAGRAYVIYGESGLADIDLENLNYEQGFIVQGDAAGIDLGHSVSGAGDINNDGYDDLIVAAPYADTQSGISYIIYGGNTGTEDTTPVTLAGTGAADNFTGNAGADTFTEISTDDVVRGGAGIDRIEVVSDDFADLDGGNGTDYLAIGNAAGLTLDLTAPQTRISNFELIELDGNGDNTLVLDRLSALRQTEFVDPFDDTPTLFVIGNAGDAVTFDESQSDWLLVASSVSTTELRPGQEIFVDIYEHVDGSVRVVIEQGVAVEFTSTPAAVTLSTTKLSLEFADESGVPEDLPLPAGELPDVPLHVLQELRGETLSIQGTERAPTERSAADDAGNSAQPIDQIWEDDALTASMLHLDLADGIDALS